MTGIVVPGPRESVELVFSYDDVCLLVCLLFTYDDAVAEQLGRLCRSKGAHVLLLCEVS